MLRTYRQLILTATGCVIAGAVSSGCAINVNLNANRFESPETHGRRLGAATDVSIGGSQTLVPVPDAAGNPLQISAANWDRANASLRAGASLGVFDDLDLGLKLAWNGPSLFYAKYQLLGRPAARAQSGNFALAVTMGAGFTEPAGDVQSGGTGITTHYDFTVTIFDFGLIAGYRVAETWMIYGGPFLSSANYSGKLTQTGNVHGEFPLSGSATQGGAHVGMQLDSVLGAVRLEEAWADSNTSGNGRYGFYTGLDVSYRFQ